MTDIRVKDLDESAVPGADYWLLTDSATDGPKKVKPSNIVTKADIGLGNVDNTSDANKPISTAVQTALDGKATAAQGAKADTAVQPGVLGDLAVKDKITVSDVDAIGTPSSSTWWRGDGVWATPAGAGDMLKANDLSDVDDANAALKNLGGSATFDTRTLAASYSPKTAPDSIVTQGLAAIGDGGDGLYKRNGTTTGDLVITLDDGTTHVGYNLQRGSAGYRPGQNAVIGNVDDRTAFQAALDKMQDGDTFVFPGWATATIVNGVGTGADIVAKRADAVANGGLRALTCDKNNIRIVIDGHVKATSALDDLFRFTGDNVQVTGRGLLENTSGVWLDTNPAGEPNPDLVQWYPSLVYFAGDDSGVDGGGALRFLNPCQTGARLGGNRNYSFRARYIGGPPSYRPNGGLGTAMFAIYSGLPSGENVDNKVIGNWFIPNDTGGRMYQSIFSTSARAIYADNHHEGAWELGIYNYGADCKIHSEHMNNVEAAIQNVATGCSIRDCRITAISGSILCFNSSYLQIEGNVVRTNNIGISLRRSVGTGVPQTNVDRDIIIANNLVELFGAANQQQSAIDVFLDNSVVGLEIAGNQVVGGGEGVDNYAGIRVIGYASDLALDVNVTENSLRNANGAAVHVQYCRNPHISRNRIINANNDSGANGSAITCSAVSGALFSENFVQDLRGTPLTKRIVSALSDDSNSGIRAIRNVGMNLDPSETSLVVIPSDSSSEAHGNSRNNAPTQGRFFVTNSISDGVTAPGVVGNAKIVLSPANPAADVLQQSAKRIYANSVSNGIFSWSTADSTATGTTAAEYLWEAIQ